MKNRFSLNILPWILIICLSTVALQQQALAHPLFTKSRWIVNKDGKRVKLACVNWPSHLQPVLAEGLSWQPVDAISNRIRSMGFNCVRLTWPLALVNNQTIASMTVENSFNSLGLHKSLAGIRANNGKFLRITLPQAFKKVVSSLEKNKVMVVLDNHITTPGWCCSENDGSGFFGDKDFDPKLWIQGLSRMATMFKGTKNVIGMSLRNELRGNNSNVDVWYRYMQEGAEVVHAANPNVLVILSGLEFDKDLSFLRNKQVNVSFTRKLVFEGHWYGFSDNENWVKNNANDFCGSFMNNMMNKFGFLLEQGYPVFLSEFGQDQRGGNVNDNRYFSCILGVIADLDMDWALWTLQGDYYLREGKQGPEEVYGVMSLDWGSVRNASFLQRVRAVQPPFQGPGVSGGKQHNIIFHIASGLCVEDSLRLHSCYETPAWSYNPQKNIILEGTDFCLQPLGLGLPIDFGTGLNCSESNSNWEIISNSGLHLSSKLPNGETVCLDVDKNGILVTNQCRCLSKDSNCDPTSQWFKIVKATTKSTVRG